MFLIVWLLLRGLLGDAMAMEVMPQHGPAHTVTASADRAPAAHHTADLASMDSAHADLDAHCSTAPATDHAEPGNHATDHCSSCMVCHSACSPGSAPPPLPAAPHAEAPISTHSTLTSAPARSVLKPPIV